MGYSTGVKIKSFFEITGFDFIDQLKNKIKKEIEDKSKDYILSVDEDEFKQYLIDKYNLEPLTVYYDTEKLEEPRITKEWREDGHYRDKYECEVYNFTITYNFTGSAVLFKVQPSSSYTMTSSEIFVDEYKHTVSFNFKLYEKNPEKFQATKNTLKQRAFTNLDNTNLISKQWLEMLPSTIALFFQQRKNKYLQENDFFAAINVQVNKDTVSVFTAPTIKKKVIPQPSISKNKEFSSEPIMAKEMYDDILKVIYDFGKSMEMKPSTYKNKDEEGIRDLLLLILETRYNGVTATGETFNKGGKTDIILKYANDGSNLFVAECKFWHGASEFQKAISQLFDRYLTWRDSKVALILFVTNKDFTNVITTIKTEAKQHPYFIKETGKRGDTSFSYNFCLPQDKNKLVFFEIIIFPKM
jgi:hypothetical protein